MEESRGRVRKERERIGKEGEEDERIYLKSKFINRLMKSMNVFLFIDLKYLD